MNYFEVNVHNADRVMTNWDKYYHKEKLLTTQNAPKHFSRYPYNDWNGRLYANKGNYNDNKRRQCEGPGNSWKVYHHYDGRHYLFCYTPDEAVYKKNNQYHENPCPHARNKVYDVQNIVDEAWNNYGNRTNKLKCYYPNYTLANNDDVKTYNNIISGNDYGAIINNQSKPVGEKYTSNYLKECNAQQELVRKKGNNISDDTQNYCASKEFALNICSRIGLSVNDCFFSDTTQYKELCLDNGAKNGKFVKQNGVYIFDFDSNYPGGGSGICTDAGAIKEYSRRIRITKLGDPTLDSVAGISGRNYTSMKKLHEKCKTTKTFNISTGKITDNPLSTSECNVSTVQDYIKNFNANKRDYDKGFAEEQRNLQFLEGQKGQADRMLAAQKSALKARKDEAEKNLKALKALTESGNNSNDIIKAIIDSENSSEDNSSEDNSSEDNSKKNKGKGNNTMIIIVVVIVILILLGVFLLM